MDNREVFLAAADAVAELVGRIPAESWDNPALGSWDVRGLVGHTGRALTTVLEYLAAPPAAERTLASAADYLASANQVEPSVHVGVAQRGVAAGVELGDQPAAAFSALVATARDALEANGSADPTLTTIFGGIGLSEYLVTRTFELVVHGSDIATACRLPLEFDRAAVHQALTLAADSATINGLGLKLLRMATGRDGSLFSVF